MDISFSKLEALMLDRETWLASGHGVTKSWTRLHDWTERDRSLGTTVGFPGGVSGKEPTWQFRRQERCWFDPWVGKILLRRKWQPTPVFLPEKSLVQGRLAAIVLGVSEYQTGLRIWIQREGEGERERERERERDQCRRVFGLTSTWQDSPVIKRSYLSIDR